MNEIVFNIVFALVIGVVIAVIASVKGSRTKALIYSLPIPMSLALIATGGNVDTSHIIGLLIVTLFLWLVTYLSSRGVHIVIADIVSATAYIGVGYVVITYTHIPFYIAVATYALLWLLFISLYREKKFKESKKKIAKISPIIKFPIVSVVAFALLNLKTLLSGVVVTFPFSGVFAVIETQNILRTLSATFARNSLGMLIFFTTIHIADGCNLVLKLAIGWAVYLVTLKLITTFVPFKIAK
jgi:hypothetical protein